MNRRGFISSVIGGLASAVAVPFVGRAATIPTAITSINGLPDKYAVKSEWYKPDTIAGWDSTSSQILIGTKDGMRWVHVDGFDWSKHA